MRAVGHRDGRTARQVALAWSHERFGSGTAQRLQNRFDEAGRLLLRPPDLGALAVDGARKLPLGRFPYTLVYSVQAGTIFVLA